jgi:hypothetical protein
MFAPMIPATWVPLRSQQFFQSNGKFLLPCELQLVDTKRVIKVNMRFRRCSLHGVGIGHWRVFAIVIISNEIITTNNLDLMRWI